MSKTLSGWLLAAVALGPPVLGQTGNEAPETSPPSAVEEIVAALEPTSIRALAREVLARNPELARLRAEAAMAASRAPQARSLPDPMASITAFPMPPETRVGPVRWMAELDQSLPWRGKRAAAEREALWVAAAERGRVEARALELVTEARQLWWELAYLEAEEEIVRADRYTLERFEELTRARYAAGAGTGQPVVKIQAEITRADQRLLDVAVRRAALTAVLNALRDGPADAAVEVPELPPLPPGPDPALEERRRQAAERRPELALERARVAAAEAAGERAGLERRPDVTIGLAYTVVGKREDEAGRAMPPEGNGDDDIAVRVGINLPVRTTRIEAGIAEAAARASAAEEALRGVAAMIERDLGDLVQRVRLSREQSELFEAVLVPQTEEALRSAEAAYTAGTLRALDILDAERTLFQVRLAAARARADHLVARARLEGAVAGSLDTQGATP